MKTKAQGTDKRGDVVIYLRMDKTLATEMKAIAKRQSRTIAGQIAFALWQWLDAQPPNVQVGRQS